MKSSVEVPKIYASKGCVPETKDIRKKALNSVAAPISKNAVISYFS